MKIFLVLMMFSFSIIFSFEEVFSGDYVFLRQEQSVQKRENNITYETSDGWTIHASFYPSFKKNMPLFIDIHMLMSDRSYYPVRSSLLKNFNVLKIDMRGHGDSILYRGVVTEWRSGKGNMYWGSFTDINAGVDEVRKLSGGYVDTENIFLQGNSYSCVLLLQYFLKYPERVRGLIFMSGGDSYGQNYIAEYKRMAEGARMVPVLHVCSCRDFYCITKTRGIEEYFRARLGMVKSARQEAAFRLTRFIYEDEHVHGTHFFYTHTDKYPAVIIEWMNRVLEETKPVDLQK